MAITTVPYGQFLIDVGNSAQNMRNDGHFAMLLTGDYIINQSTDTFASVSAFELPNDSDDDGYKTGGQQVDISSQTLDQVTRTYVLTASGISWNKLTGSVRYIVIRNDSSKLCGVCDLGAATTYTAQPFQITFPSGLFTIVGV